MGGFRTAGSQLDLGGKKEVTWLRERKSQAMGRRPGRKVKRYGMFLPNLDAEDVRQ